MNKVLSDDAILYFNQKLGFFAPNYKDLFNVLKKELKAFEVALLYNYILSKSSDERLIAQTIREINSAKYIDNYPFLLDFLKTTENVDLKVLAIKTIAVYKNASCVSVLMDCLNDKNSNYKVRLSAADALGKIGDKNAFETLGNVASDTEEKSAYIKESAVVALGNLGDARAIDVFSSIMSGKDMFLDKFSYLKERIVEAILKLDITKNKKAYEILKNSLLDENPGLRISAIEAVMNSDVDYAFELIYERLENDIDIEVQKNALVALYNISDRTILDKVIQGDFALELKQCAKEILAKYEVGDEK